MTLSSRVYIDFLYSNTTLQSNELKIYTNARQRHFINVYQEMLGALKLQVMDLGSKRG